MVVKKVSGLALEEIASHLCPGQENISAYLVNGWLQVLISQDGGLWHLSVSHPRRYPTWDEIKEIRYQFLPDDKTFAILFPPKEQYVNVHPNCFHLHEVPEMHEGRIIIP